MARVQWFSSSSRLLLSSIRFFSRRGATITFDSAAASPISVLLSEPRRCFLHCSNLVLKSDKDSGCASGRLGKKMSGTTGHFAKDPTKDDRIVWVDLEMTGLDVETHTIVEMAVIITDGDLNIVAESPNLIINHDQIVLENMDDWCKKTFSKSGLLEEIQKSTTSLEDAEKIMVGFVEGHTNPRKSPLAGNSVYMDRLFLMKYMPTFNAHLHYRILDVSTIKELSRRWYPRLYEEIPPKKLAHRALSDIKESIQELQWYRKNIFRPIP